MKNKIKRPINIDKKIFDDINKMQFEEIMQNPKTMIGLKDKDFTEVLINEFAVHNQGD